MDFAISVSPVSAELSVRNGSTRKQDLSAANEVVARLIISGQRLRIQVPLPGLINSKVQLYSQATLA
jgi:hypothetical protein